jgi:hypothetical protein
LVEIAETAGDDGGDGFAGNGAPGEGTVSAETAEVLRLNCPSASGIDYGDVG